MIARRLFGAPPGSSRPVPAKPVKRTASFLVIGLMIMTACSPTRLADPPTPTTVGVSTTLLPNASQTLFDQDLGVGSFEFGGYGPYPDVAIDVFYAAPPSLLDSVPILIVMPGRGRNAEEYRDDWMDQALDDGAVLLVPEFPDDVYSSADYNLGHLFDSDGDSVPSAEWTFAVVDALFDYVAEEISSKEPGFYLYGHSAGGQFVHRYMLFTDDNRVIRAVSANSGWYTVPDLDVDFPYGLKGSPIDDERQLEGLLDLPLTILLGTEDNDPDADGLRQDSGSAQQGATRLDRGFYFFRTAQLLADDLEVPFGWHIEMVNGVGHSNADMVKEAAAALFGDSR